MENDLDLDTAGRLSTKKYDNGDGVFSIIYMQVTVIGPDAYIIVRERLNNLEDGICEEAASETYIECYIGQVHVEMRRTSLEAPSILIRIKDPHNGRNQNEEK